MGRTGVEQSAGRFVPAPQDIRQKVEVRFVKGEDARFISHHDLMRAFQRALRRSGLPVRQTAGFNPRPRLVFPAALETGVASLDEAVEIEFTQWNPLDLIQNRLAACLPPGLSLLSLREIPPHRRGAMVSELRFKVHLAERRLAVSPRDIARLLAAPRLPFRREQPWKERGRTVVEVDLRPALAGIALDAGGDLEITLRPSPAASARPLEVLSLLTGLPLSELRRVRVTKLRTGLAPAP
jgi:radical SAM-linked protein